MSMAEFLQQLDDKRFSKNEQKWFPKWLAGYVQHHHLNQNHIPIKTPLVLSFLQSLRDANIPPWRRLQAAQALSSYQRHVLAKQDVNFQTFINKLTQLSRLDDHREFESDDHVPRTPPTNHRNAPPPHTIVVPGEGHPGLVNQKQPQVIQQMTRTLRMLHHPKSTEVAYLGWIRRFIRHLDDEDLQRYGEPEIGEFLTDLAVTQHVTAGTQNQALAACLFLYQKVLGRDLRFIHTVRAKSSQYRPVVLTKREVNEILSRLTGRNRLEITRLRPVFEVGNLHLPAGTFPREPDWRVGRDTNPLGMFERVPAKTAFNPPAFRNSSSIRVLACSHVRSGRMPLMVFSTTTYPFGPVD